MGLLIEEMSEKYLSCDHVAIGPSRLHTYLQVLRVVLWPCDSYSFYDISPQSILARHDSHCITVCKRSGVWHPTLDAMMRSVLNIVPVVEIAVS